MKKILFILFVLFVIILSAQANNQLFKENRHFSLDKNQKNDTTYVSINLNKIDINKLSVVIKPPKILTKNAVFVIPQIVPGTYLKVNYKRFYSKFKAFNKEGKELITKRKGNHFIIKNATQLHKIEYQVKQSQGDKRIWDNIIGCAGTIFDKESSLINFQLITGYLEGFKERPIKISVLKPKKMFGATALSKVIMNKNNDVFVAKNYAELIDSPLLYAKADTLSFKVENAKFHVAVYSQNKVITAKLLEPNLKQVITNIHKHYGNLPSKDYHFIFYCINDLELNMFTSFGVDSALEHLNSSVYYLSEDLKTTLTYVNYIATHEYLHTFTPLTIRSEKISDFNFDNPNMSKHMWFYEGLTDYTATLILERYKMKSFMSFKNEISESLNATIKYKARSLTKSSEEIINKNMFDWFGKILQISNFYTKGKLVSFCLDVELFKLSHGEMRLKDLILKLQEKYDFNNSFNDDEFLDILVENSYPEIKPFVEKYIKGNTLVPYQQYFDLLGWEYITKKQLVPSFGLRSKSFSYDREVKKYRIRERIKNNLNLQKGDYIMDVSSNNVNKNSQYEDRVIRLLFPNKNEEIDVTIKRNNEIIHLKSIANKTRKSQFSTLNKTSIQTEKQEQFRNEFLYKN